MKGLISERPELDISKLPDLISRSAPVELFRTIKKINDRINEYERAKKLLENLKKLFVIIKD